MSQSGTYYTEKNEKWFCGQKWFFSKKVIFFAYYTGKKTIFVIKWGKMVFSQKSILHQNHFSCQMDPKKNHFLAREHLYNHRSASWRAPLSVPPFSQIIQCLLHLFVANFISLFVYFYPPHLTLSSLFLSVALKGRMDSTDMRLMHVVTLAGLLGVLGHIPYGPISSNRIRRFLSLHL